MPDIPHLDFPFRRTPTGVAVVEQDTPEHVTACVNMIVRCPAGFRVERPDFGWPFPEFRTVPLDLGALEEALGRLEPRARTTAVDVADAADAAVRNVTIKVES